MQIFFYRRLIPAILVLLLTGACFVSKKNSGREALLVYRGKPVTTVNQWNKKRNSILKQMQEAMGPLPRLKNIRRSMFVF
ncbi:hypothetical protein [Niabella hirudinis]|uniref:hypothetical protein n=1 Tax=Niabella hirudinis TaxID=1285929 RepID=UPI003EB8699B